MTKVIANRTMHCALMLALCLLSSCLVPSSASITNDLRDSYLEREFDWAMYIELPNSAHYLRYPGSQLNPLTKVRVHFRPFIRYTGSNTESARVYEEFWYHKGRPVGSRRFSHVNMESRYPGAIVVGEFDGKSEESRSVTNVLVRLMLDLQLQKMSTTVVMVPKDSYGSIATYLANYNFFPRVRITPFSGPQMSIHLRAYPSDHTQDEYFYYSKSDS